MLVLASRSPQRRAILEQLGVAFVVEVPGVDELEEGDAAALVLENARRKARAVAERRAAAGMRGAAVLAVDTTVALGERILGKPAGEREAAESLRALAGRTHAVHSGIVVLSDRGERAGHARTAVTFRPLDERLLAWYLATGEWRERAGGYAIQGRGAALVEAVDGDFWNVVGLPVPELMRIAPEIVLGDAPPAGAA